MTTDRTPECCVNCYAGGPCTCDAATTQVAQPDVSIARYDEADYGGMKPKAKGEWVRYEDMQEVLAHAALPASGPQHARARGGA